MRRRIVAWQMRGAAPAGSRRKRLRAEAPCTILTAFTDDDILQ